MNKRFAGDNTRYACNKPAARETTRYNSFAGACAELSLLKLCHGEKECHVMEQLRQDIASSRPV